MELNFPIFSAACERFGKPHPAVYMRFCEYFNVLPENALAFEDSLNGAIAAKAAKIHVVTVPEREEERARFEFSDMVLKSLSDLDLDFLS